MDMQSPQMRTTKVAKSIRRWARFTAGVAFWLHTLLFFGVPVSSLEITANRIGLNVPEMLLVLFFLTMSILNVYGFWKLIIDLTYIYFFPFIFLYNVAVVVFKILSRIPGYAAKFVPGIRPTFTWKALLKELVADEASFVALTTQPATVNQSVVPASVVSTATPKRNLRSRLSLPFRSFTIVWCILLLATNKPLIALGALLVLVVHVSRFLVNLTRLLTKTQQFLADAERKVMSYAMNLLNTVMSASDESLANEDVARAVTLLTLFRASAFLLVNRGEVKYLLFLAVCLVYAAMYIRVAVLFAFLYLGVAKLNHVPLGFLDSMVNSFAMPLSYTNYPKHWLIQLCEDVHSVIAVGLGIGAALAYVRQKFDAFKVVADDLWEKLDKADVRTRMSYAASKAKAAKKAPIVQTAS